MNLQSLEIMSAAVMLGLATVGSGIGMSIVGSAAVGAWKRCYKANKPAPMTILALCGMPVSQTFYGFILMQQMLSAATAGNNSGLLLGIGFAVGFTMLFTAVAQGQISAAACDAVGETGKGFANYLAAIGIAESIALFAMVFSMLAMGMVGTALPAAEVVQEIIPVIAN